jgi:hypothetical protein
MSTSKNWNAVADELNARSEFYETYNEETPPRSPGRPPELPDPPGGPPGGGPPTEPPGGPPITPPGFGQVTDKYREERREMLEAIKERKQQIIKTRSQASWL